MYKRFVVNGRFDATRDFEYRDYVLHLEKADFHTFMVEASALEKRLRTRAPKLSLGGSFSLWIGRTFRPLPSSISSKPRLTLIAAQFASGFDKSSQLLTFAKLRRLFLRQITHHAERGRSGPKPLASHIRVPVSQSAMWQSRHLPALHMRGLKRTLDSPRTASGDPNSCEGRAVLPDRCASPGSNGYADRPDLPATAPCLHARGMCTGASCVMTRESSHLV
jgi:hypothetical protein